MGYRRFERVTPESAGVRSSDIEWLLDRLEGGHTQMHGLMLMRFGKVIAEGWWAPFAPGLRHGLQSLSKTYAATAVGIACTEGLVTTETKIVDLFPDDLPENPSEYLKQLKVRDVLCMGCGMDEMPAPGKEWVKQFLATPVLHKPGSVFMYNSLGSSFLGEIVKKVSGEGLMEYLTPRLFDKIGIDAGNLRWLCHPDGMEVGGGGLYATTEDNLRLMRLYLDGGVWEGERILSEEYVKLATSVQNDSSTEVLVNPPATDNFVGYGFQIWMCKYPGAYRADGAMGQFSICVPDLDMIISINETAVGAEGIQITLDYLWEFLEKIDADTKELPEDEKAQEHLARRMRRLAAESPRYTAYCRALEKYNGASYTVEYGKENKRGEGETLGFETQIMRELIGGECTRGIDCLKFEFAPYDTKVHFEQDGRAYTLSVALDGTRKENHIGIAGEVASVALASGCFPEDDTFEVTALWPETCYTKTVRFKFEGDEINISTENYPLTTTVPGGTKKMMEPGHFRARRSG